MKAAGWWLIACTLTACQAEQKATLSGYVEAESVRVAASVSGQLQIVAVQRGDTVAVGQTLFGLDSDKEQAKQKEPALLKSRMIRWGAVIINHCCLF